MLTFDAVKSPNIIDRISDSIQEFETTLAHTT